MQASAQASLIYNLSVSDDLQHKRKVGYMKTRDAISFAEIIIAMLTERPRCNRWKMGRGDAKLC